MFLTIGFWELLFEVFNDPFAQSFTGGTCEQFNNSSRIQRYFPLIDLSDAWFLLRKIKSCRLTNRSLIRQEVLLPIVTYSQNVTIAVYIGRRI